MSDQPLFIDKTKEVRVDLFELIGRKPFIACGDEGLALRKEAVMPLLQPHRDETVIIDCTGIENMTDSFANAFFGPICADHFQSGRVKFKGCTPLVKSFILSAWSIELRLRENSV